MAHNIERTYHDVTSLDSRTALTKIKDIMDISSGAEFFSVSKDSASPIAVKPLVFDASHTDFKYYLKPGEKYTVGRDLKYNRNQSVPMYGDIYLRMHVKLEDIELDYFESNPDFSKEWYEEKKSILKKIDEIIIYGEAGAASGDAEFYHIYLRNSDNTYNIYSSSQHGMSKSKFDIGLDADKVIYGEYGENNYRLGSIFDYYDFQCEIPASLLNVLSRKYILKFTLLYVTDDSTFDAGDVNAVLNKLIVHSSDNADILYLSQSPENRYTVTISDTTDDFTRFNAVFDDLLPNLPAYVGRSIREANDGSYEDLIETIARDLFDDDLFIDDEYIGEPMSDNESKYGGKFDLGDLRSSILTVTNFDKKIVTQSELVLFSDVNYGTANVIKSLIEALGGGTVNIYAHSSRQLFRDVTLTSITHPIGSQLIIGNDNLGLHGSSFADYQEENRISFINDIEFNWNSLYNIDEINTDTINALSGAIEDLSVTNELTVTNDAIFSSDVTVSGNLSLNTITLSSIADSSYSSTNANTPFKLLSANNQGQLFLTGIQFVPGVTNGNITFLNKEGTFTTLTQQFLQDTLGVAPLSHSHGGLQNNGTFSADTAITNGSTTFKMVVTDANGVIRKSNIAFDRTNIYSSGTTPNTSAASPNAYYLSKGGDWKSMYDALYRGVVTNLNNATDLGIYTFGDTAAHNPTCLPKTASANDETKPYDNRKSVDTRNTDTNYGRYGGTLYVLRTSSAVSGDIVQLAYIPIATSNLADTETYNYPNPTHTHERLYMRVASVQSGNWTFGDWTYFTQYDHNHDSSYVKIDNAKVKNGITIHSRVAESDLGSSMSSDSSDYYSITHSAVGNNRYYTHKLNTAVSGESSFLKLIFSNTARNGNTEVLVIGEDNSTLSNNLTVNGDVTVKGTAAATNNIKFFKTTNTYIGGALYMRPTAATAIVSNANTDVYTIDTDTDNGDSESPGKVLFLTNDYNSHNGQGQIKESNVGIDKVRYISTLTSDAQTQITNLSTALSNHKGGATAEAAHGYINSDGTLSLGTSNANAVSIANNDRLLIVDNSASNKIAPSSIKFDGSTTTQYLAKKGDWVSLPGDANYTNNVYSGGFISATDYEHLLTLWNAYGSDNASDTVVNKIQEIIAAFANFPESATLENRYYKKSGGTISGNVTLSGGDLTLQGDGKNIEVQKGVIKVTGSGNVFTGTSNAESTDVVGTVIYSNAITFRDPSTSDSNDGAWIKYREATRDSGILEIGTANNANELIYFRAYNSGTLRYQFQVPTDETTGILASRKYSDDYNGVVKVTVSGTGIGSDDTSTTNASHNVQISLDSSSAGNAAANKVVLRNDAGSIQSEKIAISSGTTTKAMMQYNTSEDCIDFIFA